MRSGSRRPGISEEAAGRKTGDGGREHETIEEFSARVREELGGLGPDEGQEYESLKRAERVALAEIAKELGYWHGSPGGLHGLFIFNEGNEAKIARQRLEAVRPGGRLFFEHADPSVRLFARGAAEGYSLSVTPPAATGSGAKAVEVFNLGGSLEEFSAGIHDLFSKLQPGEILDLPPALNEAQQEVARLAAVDLGYHVDTFGFGLAQHLSVGNLDDFKSKVRADCEALSEGATHIYGPGSTPDSSGSAETPDDRELHPLERCVVRDVGDGLSLKVLESAGEGGAKLMSVLKPAQVSSLDDSAKDQEKDESIEDTMRQHLREVFDRYATGRDSLLRKPDLVRFIEDSCRARFGNKNDYDGYLAQVEETYEEVLELQVDLGSRFHHGITLDYFQVFMSKAAHAFGASLLGLLRSLLDFWGA